MIPSFHFWQPRFTFSSFLLHFPQFFLFSSFFILYFNVVHISKFNIVLATKKPFPLPGNQKLTLPFAWQPRFTFEFSFFLLLVFSVNFSHFSFGTVFFAPVKGPCPLEAQFQLCTFFYQYCPPILVAHSGKGPPIHFLTFWVNW